ncbi:VCBS repeat-containing protein [Pseudoclavibacter chungangensis]|uniref:VCBS repeat-containing protein n=1 Tax=Pseudoclavibacter chungangensis TaxID=587635 RepID=A0A7J5C1J4_9MICO|nr:VCBS repeat-containing protein [Pseudoclavibacter chungangensis]KAB1662507.1 VCBS repeat-containing protein [Pseudoclavibacter chungangensis]NYJ68545.1 hypothetical protein [Pseudoclavibacter chungangensis]
MGDIDGDGRDEVGVTDTNGEVTVLDAETLAAETALTSTSGPRVRGTGIDLVSTAAAGDVNGDGRDDLYVGAASWTVPGSSAFATGAGWVFTEVSGTVEVGAGDVPGFRINGPVRGYDLMGGSAVGIGDIDGDGLDDLMLGGDSDAPKTGSALVVLGSTSRATVVTDPDAVDAPAVASTDDAGATVPRGWWINGLAADDHLGHAVGAVRMDGWSMLLVGAMDGARDAAVPGSGYALAIDSRALVDGTLPLSSSGVLESSELLGDAYEGGTIIAGHGAGVHLGRSFADFTADPSGRDVTFAVGAPALFTWDGTLPAVRIVTLRAAAPATPEPSTTTTPTGEPTSSTEPTATTGTGPGPSSTAAPTASADDGALASTGADDLLPAAFAAAALVLAGLLALALRHRPRRQTN